MIPFRKILIANRGEIARRVQRTCRAMGIRTAAIYADPDRDAPFVREADEAVYIGAPVTGSSFLAVEEIVAAARRVTADAVHPGYGFLAENADFAQACADAGIVFVGPTPEAIRRMGSKIEAKALMAAAGVPVVPGFSAAGLDDGQIARRAAELGFPVLIKASAGGGGKGMRTVDDPAKLPDALAAARREAFKAFGDDTLLLERYIVSPRHVEIQILGDAHGNLVHCFERECSIQRRYQKIVEEAPSPAVDDALRARLGAAALAAGRALAYRNAGTVEFVLDPSGHFYFLEVNTRLQVEHPVTEEITGLDLVRLQIEVAQGTPLPFRQEELSLRGHAIEARIYAEDPEHDFLPSTGRIVVWDAPPLPGIRYECGVDSGSEVTIHYDPMLAKIVAHASTRTEAAARLDAALGRLRVHGVHTNVKLLRAVLTHADFVAGRTDTHFIATHLPPSAATTAAPAAPVPAEHAAAAALWLQDRNRRRAAVQRGLPSGWRNNFSRPQECLFAVGEALGAAEVRVQYRVTGAGRVEVAVDGVAAEATLHGVDDGSVRMVFDSVQRTYAVAVRDDTLYVHSALGTSELRLLPRFPEPTSAALHGGCLAPMPGRILAVRVGVGDKVARGQPLLILEAMKMEHEVVAPHDGTVLEIRVEVGQQVDSGTVLLAIEEASGDTEGERKS